MGKASTTDDEPPENDSILTAEITQTTVAEESFDRVYMDPSNYLRHIYNIMHMPQIDPLTKVQTGMQPFLFGWVRIMMYMGPQREDPQDSDDDEERE